MLLEHASGLFVAAGVELALSGEPQPPGGAAPGAVGVPNPTGHLAVHGPAVAGGLDDELCWNHTRFWARTGPMSRDTVRAAPLPVLHGYSG